MSEIDVHSVADSRFCNILFGTANTERTNHFSQARGGVSFRFIRVLFFFRFLFSFLFSSLCPSWTDHRLSKFIENVVSINAKRVFYFYRWMPIPIWDAPFRLASLFSPHSVPFLSLSLSIRLTCNSEIIARMLSQLNAENRRRHRPCYSRDDRQVIRCPIALPSTRCCNRTSRGSATKHRKPASRTPLVFRVHSTRVGRGERQRSLVSTDFSSGAQRRIKTQPTNLGVG